MTGVQTCALPISKDFLKAGIETMSDIREWRSALLNAVENGYPVMEAGMAQYRAQATTNLHLTSVAATTDSDHNAFTLLSKEFDHMQELSNRILTMRKNLSHIDRGALKNDPLDQKILTCARALSAMVPAASFRTMAHAIEDGRDCVPDCKAGAS